jgi:hypothetical protein
VLAGDRSERNAKLGAFIQKLGAFIQKLGAFIQRLGAFIQRLGAFIQKLGAFIQKSGGCLPVSQQHALIKLQHVVSTQDVYHHTSAVGMHRFLHSREFPYIQTEKLSIQVHRNGYINRNF